MNSKQLFGRPSPAILAGIIPLLLIALTFVVVLFIPVKKGEMAYVGIAWMLFFPMLFVFGIGTVGSIAAFWICVHEKRGIVLSLIVLLLNLWPFWMIGRQLLPH